VNNSTRSSAADLTVGEAETEQQPFYGLFDIDIVENNNWALAAQFERNVLDITRSLRDRNRRGGGGGGGFVSNSIAIVIDTAEAPLINQRTLPIMREPVAVLPVKAIERTSGWVVRASPTSGPKPVTYRIGIGIGIRKRNQRSTL
jgi:hypothetical protein